MCPEQGYNIGGFNEELGKLIYCKWCTHCGWVDKSPEWDEAAKEQRVLVERIEKDE